jgi:hypothetical protein
VGAAEARSPRPNVIIYVIADDLSYGDLGSYGHQKLISTPLHNDLRWQFAAAST